MKDGTISPLRYSIKFLIHPVNDVNITLWAVATSPDKRKWCNHSNTCVNEYSLGIPPMKSGSEESIDVNEENADELISMSVPLIIRWPVTADFVTSTWYQSPSQKSTSSLLYSTAMVLCPLLNVNSNYKICECYISGTAFKSNLLFYCQDTTPGDQGSSYSLCRPANRYSLFCFLLDCGMIVSAGNLL